MRGQNRVVRLNDSCRYLRCRIYSKLQLRLLAIVDAQSLHQERRESRACTAAKRVKDKKSLQAGALVAQLAQPLSDQVNDFLSDCVVASGVVVSRVLFASDHLFGVEELTVASRTHLVHNGWL